MTQTIIFWRTIISAFIITCLTNYMMIHEVPVENTLALRTKATQQSTGPGQGFVKCKCTCESNFQNKICLSVKSSILCSSKFHSSSVCCNK